MNRFLRARGFTLIELLVVLAIIGILASALTVSISKVGESARAARCKANLKNLAQAALSAANEDGTQTLPRAGSFDVLTVERINNRWKNMYWEARGWVGWVGRQREQSNGHNSTPGKNAETATCFSRQLNYNMSDNAYQSLTNGVLWEYVGGEVGTYVCEQHKKVCRSAGRFSLRSYVMNGSFGWAVKGNNEANPDRRVKIGDLSLHGDAGRLLLFAEMSCYQPGSRDVSVKDGETDADSVLQSEISGYAGTENEEMIGFNHRVGKRNVAHVAFADGHVDVLAEPTGANKADLLELTESLCNGEEIDITIQKRMH